MRKVKEIDTLNKCEKKWSSSKKEYEKIRKELADKMKEYKNTSKVKETIEENKFLFTWRILSVALLACEMTTIMQ